MKKNERKPAPRDPFRPVTLTGQRVNVSGITRRPGKANDPHRKELSRLLWGDLETGLPHASGVLPKIEDRESAVGSRDCDSVVSAKIPAATPAPSETSCAKPVAENASSTSPIPDSRSPTPDSGIFSRRRRQKRRACSFPGLLRMMLPEVSFHPLQFAVRVVDLNPQGARLESRQITANLIEAIAKEKRHARVEAIVPGREKLILQGAIVWSRTEAAGLANLGMQFDRVLEDLEDFFLPDEEEELDAGIHDLESPVLDPFPGITKAERLKLAGSAAGADQVLLHHRGECQTLAVVDDRFECEVVLSAARSNFLAFVAVQGQSRSVPTPVCIVQQPNEGQLSSFRMERLLQSLEVSPNGRTLSLELRGSAGRYFQALKRIEQALRYAEQIDMKIELTGDAESAARLFRVLEKEG